MAVLFVFALGIFYPAYNYFPVKKFHAGCFEVLPPARDPLPSYHLIQGKVTNEFTMTMVDFLKEQNERYFRLGDNIYITKKLYEGEFYAKDTSPTNMEMAYLTNEAVKILLAKRKQAKKLGGLRNPNMDFYADWDSSTQKQYEDFTKQFHTKKEKSGSDPTNCAFLEKLIVKGGALSSGISSEAALRYRPRFIVNSRQDFVFSNAAAHTYLGHDWNWEVKKLIFIFAMIGGLFYISPATFVGVLVFKKAGIAGWKGAAVGVITGIILAVAFCIWGIYYLMRDFPFF